METMRNVFNWAAAPFYILNETLQMLTADISACAESTLSFLCRAIFNAISAEEANVYEQLPWGGTLLHDHLSSFGGAAGAAFLASRCFPMAKRYLPENLGGKIMEPLDRWRYELSATASLTFATYWELTRPSGKEGSFDWEDFAATALALAIFYGLNQATKPPPGDPRLVKDFHLG